MPKLKPPKKKVKLIDVPKDKENQRQFVDDEKKAALGKSLYQKIPLQVSKHS